MAAGRPAGIGFAPHAGVCIERADRGRVRRRILCAYPGNEVNMFTHNEEVTVSEDPLTLARALEATLSRRFEVLAVSLGLPGLLSHAYSTLAVQSTRQGRRVQLKGVWFEGDQRRSRTIRSYARTEAPMAGLEELVNLYRALRHTEHVKAYVSRLKGRR